MTLFSPAKTEADKSPIGIIVGPSGNSVCQSGEGTPVGNVLPEMSDEEREAAAYRAGVAMNAWYSRYQETGDRAALHIAHRHLTQMLAILMPKK
jgi:hypothetical protein